MWGDVLPLADVWGDVLPFADVYGDVLPSIGSKYRPARSQASAAVELNSSIFWVIFIFEGQTVQEEASSWTIWSLKMEPIGSTETSVLN